MRRTNAATPAVQPHENVDAVMRLENKALHGRTTAERIADSVTTVAGSTPFLILHVVWFGGWMLVNTGVIRGVSAFDPFPFSFLTLVVSLEVIFVTLLVLMSQNRMRKEADKRAHLDLQLSMLAEQEGTMSLRMLRRICKHLGLQEEEEDQQMQRLEEATDVGQLARTLEKKLPK
jgi:uncharacterized membrane protein